ncbi:MAG: XRE family transcriptional regulator [bacterium]
MSRKKFTIVHTIGERIRHLRGEESLRSFADKLGVSFSSLRFYEDGRLPPADFILALSNATLVSCDWILRSSPEKKEPGVYSEKDGFKTNHWGLFNSECLPAKPGSQEGSFMNFPPLSGEISRFIHLKLITDSMSPILPERTTVTIDTEKRNPRQLNGKIVALKIKEKLAVRHLYLQKHYYKLCCENHLYCPVFVSRTEQNLILGQVISFYGEL